MYMYIDVVLQDGAAGPQLRRHSSPHVHEDSGTAVLFVGLIKADT